MKLAGRLGAAGGALFLIALIVLFGTLSLRWLIADVGWYERGFEINGISAVTGISDDQLRTSARQISRYLLMERDRIDDLSVTVGNQTRPLFNEREILHLGHVRDFIGWFYFLQYAAAGFVLLYLALSRPWMGSGRWRQLGQRLRWGGILTLAVFAGFGLLSMLNFEGLFLQFHLVSFEGNCWLFDGTKDYLVMMFPEGFWNDSAIRLAVLTAAQAVAAVLLGTLLRSLRPSPVPR